MSTVPYVQAMQDKLRALFSEDELQQIEAIRNKVETRGRHPLVILLYTGNNDFPRQHLANIVTGLDVIRRFNPTWTLSSGWKKRLLDPDIDTSASVLGEIQVYAYLLQAFPGTTPVPTSKRKTPDFEVPHYLKEQALSVFVEVHSKSWSKEMHATMQKVNTDLAAGKIGGAGPVKIVETVVRPFAGANPASKVEDGVSKLASIGAKSAQTPERLSATASTQNSSSSVFDSRQDRM